MNIPHKDSNTDDLTDNQSEKQLEFNGPCQVCGRPGFVQAHPSAPVSVIRCEKHSDTRTFNPIYVVMAVFGVTAVGVLIYIINMVIKRFA